MRIYRSHISTNAGTMVRESLQRRIRHLNNANWDILAIYLISLSTFATLVSIFGPTIYIVEHHQEASMDVRFELPDAGPPGVDVDDLPHEELFKKTIKQCLPSSENTKCREFVPEPIKGKKVQRVAVLAPPGDVSDSLYQRVQHIVREHNQAVLSAKETTHLPIQVIKTSHVPPYGYGKTHGYTKVIRLVPEPLILEVTDALTSILSSSGESHTTVTDLQAALRMILRFHCRVSHLAAHTALLSLPLMELLSDTTESMARLRTFLAAQETDPNEQATKQGQEEEELAGEFTLDDDQSGLMDAELAYGSQILTRVQAELQASSGNSSESIFGVLDQVLVDELRLTKDMTVWPCPSFWAAGTSDANNMVPLSPALARLAQALSPDCDDPYNTCFVERDKCEFAGDAACQK